jgi:hypothetical protein
MSNDGQWIDGDRTAAIRAWMETGLTAVEADVLLTDREAGIDVSCGTACGRPISHVLENVNTGRLIARCPDCMEQILESDEAEVWTATVIRDALSRMTDAGQKLLRKYMGQLVSSTGTERIES